MLLNIDFKAIHSLLCLCLWNSSKRQNEGDVNTADVISLKQISLIIFSQDKPNCLSSITDCKIHAVQYNRGKNVISVRS